MSVYDLKQRPIHLGLGATAEVEPAFNGDMGWYEAYGDRHASDGVEGRLVSLHTFERSWDSWEMHPHGSEVVVCVSGNLTLHQQDPDGSEHSVTLNPGEYVVNAPGVWHTADVKAAATALFITAGLGTEIRPR